MTAVGKQRPRFTLLQGQYLAFIRAYTLIHREPPAEADMRRFFDVTAPSVHRMVLKLAERGLVERTPGQARSLRVVIPPEELPALEEPSSGAEWAAERLRPPGPRGTLQP